MTSQADIKSLQSWITSWIFQRPIFALEIEMTKFIQSHSASRVLTRLIKWCFGCLNGFVLVTSLRYLRRKGQGTMIGDAVRLFQRASGKVLEYKIKDSCYDQIELRLTSMGLSSRKYLCWHDVLGNPCWLPWGTVALASIVSLLHVCVLFRVIGAIAFGAIDAS